MTRNLSNNFIVDGLSANDDGPGAYPSNPSPTFGQITAVGEPRSVQFGARGRF